MTDEQTAARLAVLRAAVIGSASWRGGRYQADLDRITILQTVDHGPSLRQAEASILATRRRFTQKYQDQAVSLVPHSGRDKDLSESERVELERLRKENTTLRMERDFAKKIAAWFAKEQP